MPTRTTKPATAAVTTAGFTSSSGSVSGGPPSSTGSSPSGGSEVSGSSSGGGVAGVESNGFLALHPRMEGNFHRTALGSSPTRVTSADSGVVRTTSTHFGFPVMGELELSPGFVGCGLITHNGEPLRWRGDEGDAGQAVLFPANVRVPVSLPGDTTVRTVSAPLEPIREAAEDLGVHLESPEARVIGGPSLARLDRAILRHHESVGHERHDGYVDDEVLRGFVHVLARPGAPSESQARNESARVVTEVLDFLEASGQWRLSTLHMCRLTHVSERRLQLAFHEMFDVSPSTFLRQRALSACRQALLDGEDSDTRVSDVALDHGFPHLSRFASVYRAAFGELPSETLAGARWRPTTRSSGSRSTLGIADSG